MQQYTVEGKYSITCPHKKKLFWQGKVKHYLSPNQSWLGIYLLSNMKFRVDRTGEFSVNFDQHNWESENIVCILTVRIELCALCKQQAYYCSFLPITHQLFLGESNNSWAFLLCLV